MNNNTKSCERQKVIAVIKFTVSDFIVIGANTLRTDNPNLTTRLATGSNPNRVIVTTKLDGIDLSANVFKDDEVTIMYTELSDRIKLFPELKFKYFDGNIFGALSTLGDDNHTIMIEGGASIINQVACHCDIAVITISKKYVSGFNIYFSDDIIFVEKKRFEMENDIVLIGIFQKIA